ncbi:unnamed protein product [Vitrella brassicaformis CCMP3155]|uniref:Potassium channel tetramerisation-type BTB domain-containing protein n=2 Tax=Vitrella brassicaformis TaxID=1169539 RepID=A0A0G4E9C8_VITBC|nr:unnamed protein product [Vitrella brassicaformis CCMP3155]|mmetsp:Transcript_10381/g.29983  ORF Transcript_10381/g.29983 Transcript_10381/m.29983 type:complete len:665 (+) Transcript_10381:103-2097(+)|eukprot:CEL91981.1 unnamed protein product [Vitrella brassicaformis CCMP3155]
MSQPAAAAAACGNAEGGGQKKRKTPEGAAESDKGRKSFEQSLDVAFDCLDSIRVDLEAFKASITQRITELNGNPEFVASDAVDMQVLELNVGGEYVKVKRQTLCLLCGTVLSELFCGRWDQALLRDAQNRLFVEMYPPAFHWIVGQMLLLQDGDIDHISLPDDRQTDPSFSAYVRLLLYDPSAKKPRSTAITTPDENAQQPAPSPAAAAAAAGNMELEPSVSDPGEMATPDAGGGGTNPSPALSVHPKSTEKTVGKVSDLQAALQDVVAQRTALEQRMQALEPFLRSRLHGGEEDRVVEIDVLGTKIATSLATASHLGDDSPLFNRFCKWQNEVYVASVEHVRRVVDIVRRQRITGAMPTGEERLPIPESEREGFRRVLGMYGVDEEQLFGPTDGLLTDAHLQLMAASLRDVRELRDRPLSPSLPVRLGGPLKRVYKASLHGWRYLDFLDCIRGHGPLLLLLRAAETQELLAVLIEEELRIDGPRSVGNEEQDTEETTIATRHWWWKLEGTEDRPQTGLLGEADRPYAYVYLADLKGRINGVSDFQVAEEEGLECLLNLCGNSLSLGVKRGDAAPPPPAAAAATGGGGGGQGSDAAHRSLARCQAVLLGGERPGDWPEEWSERHEKHGEEVYCLVDDGFDFICDEIEVYALVRPPRPGGGWMTD